MTVSTLPLAPAAPVPAASPGSPSADGGDTAFAAALDAALVAADPRSVSPAGTVPTTTPETTAQADAATEATSGTASTDLPVVAEPLPEDAEADAPAAELAATPTEAAPGTVLPLAVPVPVGAGTAPAYSPAEDTSREATGTPAAVPVVERPTVGAAASPAPATSETPGFVATTPDQPRTTSTHQGAIDSAGVLDIAPHPGATTEAGSTTPPTAATASGAAVPVAPAPAAAPGAAAPAPVAVPEHVAEQLATHLRQVRRTTDGRHEATLVLDPEHLGPVRVRLSLEDGTLHVHLAGAQASTGDALRDALPDLRRQLADAGLTLGSADVLDGAWDGREGRPADPAPRRTPSHDSRRPDADPAPVVPQTHRPRHAGGVDLVA